MLRLTEITEALSGERRGSDVTFTSVSTDTRNLEPGALFVALRGECFDGHGFIEAARKGGSVAALVDAAAELDPAATGLPLLVVPDTRRALGALARFWRERFEIPLIAISGSNGKTTVKEMIAAILRDRFGEANVLATKGNLNNDIGVPLTLLGLREGHRVAVVELGVNHPGETALLADIARPTVGLINNAQREHQEFMHTVEEVARDHAAVILALPPKGSAVVNADDAFAHEWIACAGSRPVVTFGLGSEAQITARYQLAELSSQMEIVGSIGPIPVTLATAGLHNVRNALAAAAVAVAADVDAEAIKRGLESFRPVRGRLDVRAGRAGACIIDDTYNANPDSVRAAIDVLSAMSPPRILVLGDMGEVGERGEDFHAEIGRHAREAGIDRVLGIGSLAAATVEAFGPQGTHFQAQEDLTEALLGLMQGPVSILVKGSRFMHMERVVEPLLRASPLA
jgi:UDP-N-acetylmuramoyl-tripeptide--D-alanyl-D-alanine ligase